MNKILKKYLKFVIVVVIITVFFTSGSYDHLRETSFEKFTYPLEEDILRYVEEMKQHQKPSRAVINEYKYGYLREPNVVCRNNTDLVFVIKSALDHFERREAIRRSWGDEGRFPSKEIRRFFMVGIRHSRDVQAKVISESQKYGDLIQANFLDAYYNNTIKTMMSFKWLLQNCHNSKFYMFVDDDYYISTKNVLDYIEIPTEYPRILNSPDAIQVKRFYSGNCVPARPMRDLFNKYRLSIQEYAFDMFPLYSTAGAYILSRDALEELYYASHFTKHFRFDDVYLGILSRKIGIVPYHTKYIAGKWDQNDADFQQYCIASHGFEDTEEMLHLWRRQKSLGYV